MPYVQVPKDLSKVKSKIIFGLTKRQLVCFSIAGAIAVPGYLIAKPALGITGAMFLLLGLCLPAFACALYERNGQPLEKIVIRYIRRRFLRKGKRPYRTQNMYAALQRQIELNKEVQRIEQGTQAAEKTATSGKARPSRGKKTDRK